MKQGILALVDNFEQPFIRMVTKNIELGHALTFYAIDSEDSMPILVATFGVSPRFCKYRKSSGLDDVIAHGFLG